MQSQNQQSLLTCSVQYVSLATMNSHSGKTEALWNFLIIQNVFNIFQNPVNGNLTLYFQPANTIHLADPRV